ARASRSVDLFFERWVPPAAGPEDDGSGLRRAALARAVDEIVLRQGRLFARRVAPGLAELGIPVHGWSDLGAAERERLLRLLDRRFMPILTPLAVDAGPPSGHREPRAEPRPRAGRPPVGAGRRRRAAHPPPAPAHGGGERR